MHAYIVKRVDQNGRDIKAINVFLQYCFCSSDMRYENNQSSSEEESFYEITTSEADSLRGSSSDNGDVCRSHLIIRGAYSCNPSSYSSVATETAQRNLLLLFDKDLQDGDNSGICINTGYQAIKDGSIASMFPGTA